MDLILASASPQRRTLLGEAGYGFKVVPADVPEIAEGPEPVHIALLNAEAKARAVASDLGPDAVVLGADTVVDAGGVPLGQPALALAAKLIHRAKKHGENAEPVVEIKAPQIVDQATIGDLLFAVVALAAEHGVDPEQAMRSRARTYKESLSIIE